MEIVGKELNKSHKKSDKILHGLCTDCWLSGDCEREKKAGKSGEIITSCQGYLPKNTGARGETKKYEEQNL